MQAPPATRTAVRQTGIRAQIYRHFSSQPCHLLGNVDSVVIVGGGILGNAVPSERCSAVYVNSSPLGDHRSPHLRPVGHEEKWLMASGDLVYSDQPDYAAHFSGFLKLHDRFEGADRISLSS